MALCTSVATIGLGAAVQTPAAAKEVPCSPSPLVVRVHSVTGPVRCFDHVGHNVVSIRGVYKVEAGRHSGVLFLVDGVVRFSPREVLDVRPPRTAVNVQLTS